MGVDARTETAAAGGKERAKRSRAKSRRADDLAPRSVAEEAVAKDSGALDLDRAAKWSMVGIFCLLAIFALKWGAFFIVPMTVAIAMGFTFGPLVDWLECRRLPPYIASAVIVALLGGLLYGLFVAFAIPLEEWSIRVPEMLDKTRVHLYALRGTLERLQELGKSVQEAATPGDLPLPVSDPSTGLISSFLATAPAVLAQMLVFLGAFYFFLANRSRLRTWLLLLPLGNDARCRIASIFRDTEYNLSRYVAAIAVVNIGLGLVTGLTMWLLGLPQPALWGGLAAVLNFIPYLGPGLVTLAVAGVALISFDTGAEALLPPIAFLVLNLIESQFVTPTVIGHRLTLNPFMVFTTLGFWVWLWGPVGAFLAVPLLIVATVVASHFRADGSGGGAPDDRRR